MTENTTSQVRSESAQDSGHYDVNGLFLGYGESSAISIIAQELESIIPKSELGEVLQKARKEIISQKLSFNLLDLHRQTINCRKCKAFSPSPNLPMWNVKNPDVVFVVDYPIQNKQVAEAFLKALKKASFTSSQVCLTYVNRCENPKRKFELTEIQNCSSYLHLELQIMNPRAIVCLGGTAASVLYGKDITIKDYRSKQNWLGSWPIFVTYSPFSVTKSGDSTIDGMVSDFQMIYNYLYGKGEKNESSQH